MAPPSPHPARGLALAVTSLTKVGGLVLAVHEGLGAGRSNVLIVAAFMMAGAQFSETVLLGFFDRFFARAEG